MIKINDEKLDRIISESIDKVLNEIDYRTAALSHGANYNAKVDYNITKNRNARTKMGRSENITIKALTTAIHNNFQNLNLEFVEDNNDTDQSYPVDLRFTDVKYIDKKRVVLNGELTLSLRPFGNGTIEYNFNTQEFYRVSYSDKTTQSRRLHSLRVHNEKEVNELLTFISNYLYAREDYENMVDTNGSTPSKRH